MVRWAKEVVLTANQEDNGALPLRTSINRYKGDIYMSGKYHRLSLGKDENGKRIFIDEHRFVMEQYLGRKLERNEIVHHINGNKSDNRIENLQIMTLSEHSKKHMTGRKFNKKQREKLSKLFKNRKNPTRPKTKEDIIEITKKYIELNSYRKVDRFFGFANGTTGNIIRGINYNDYQPIIQKMLKSNITL